MIRKYKVIDLRTGQETKNTLVLNLDRKRDLDFAFRYMKEMKDSFRKDELKEYLSFLKKNKCKAGTNRKCNAEYDGICCAECPELQDCLLDEDSRVCPFVECGEVGSIKECELEG